MATLPTLLAPAGSGACCVGSVDPIADLVLASLMEAHEAGLAEVFEGTPNQWRESGKLEPLGPNALGEGNRCIHRFIRLARESQDKANAACDSGFF